MSWLALFSPARWVAMGLAAAIVLGGGWFALHQAEQRGYARALAEQAQAAQQAQAKARAAEVAHANQVAQLKEDFYASTATTNQAAQSAQAELARLRTQLERLRPFNGPLPPGPGLAGLDGLQHGAASSGAAAQGHTPSPAVDDPATTAWALLGQCAEQHVDMAGQADRIADQLRALQAWVLSLKVLE